MPDPIVTPPAGVTAPLDLRSLIDVAELQRIQDDFASSTGLAMITVDAMGRPVTEASRFRILRSGPSASAVTPTVGCRAPSRDVRSCTDVMPGSWTSPSRSCGVPSTSGP